MDPGFNSLSLHRQNQKTSEIVIKLQDARNKERHFLVRKEVPIRETLLSYCHSEGLEYKAMKFLFDGIHVNEFHTPDDLGLETGDIINVFSDQTGGGRRHPQAPASTP